MIPPSQAAVPWEKVYIFVSSTFNDMHAERDYLVKQVFPRLGEWCERRKLRMMDIDLRWGVTEQDATRNKNVVNVCLRRIDECRPFFLCFLGQRYGYTPKRQEVSSETFKAFPALDELLAEPRSITELEILHALVTPFHASTDSTRYAICEAAFFYFRCPDYLTKLPVEPHYLRRIYTDEAESDRERKNFLLGKQARLKYKTIRSTLRPILYYQTKWFVDENTPELALPLQCPALLPENIERWRNQWKEAADIEVVGENIAQQQQVEIANQFNDSITRGRLGNFRTEGAELGDRILQDLQSAISLRYPYHVELTERSKLQTEIDQQEQFLFVNTEAYVERPGDFQQLDEYVTGDSTKLLILASPAGTGKTMLLANWVDRNRRGSTSDTNSTFHFRFIGQGDLSTNVSDLLYSLLQELQQIYEKIPRITLESTSTPNGSRIEMEVPLQIPTDPEKLQEIWPQLLAGAGRIGRTVLIIDGLNQLESGLAELDWLPRELPENVKIVISFKLDKESEQKVEFFRETGAIVMAVQPFEEIEDRMRLVRAYLLQYLKELDEHHLQTLIHSEGAENPLFLKVVLSEIRIFGAFSNLAAKIREDFGLTPISAFRELLNRLETDPAYSPIPPESCVPLLFGLFAHARRGLSVPELTQLFIKELALSPTQKNERLAQNSIHFFLRQVRPFMGIRDGRYDFFYESFKVACIERYSGATGNKKETGTWHKILADHFYEMPNWKTQTEPMRRKAEELPYHLAQAEEWELLEKILCDLNFIEAKCASGMAFDLLTDYQRAGFSYTKQGPLIRTALKSGGKFGVNCQQCLGAFEVAQSQIGQILRCRFCNASLKLNPFFVTAEWDPLEPQMKSEMAGSVSQFRLTDRAAEFGKFLRNKLHIFTSDPGLILQEALNSAESSAPAAAARELYQVLPEKKPWAERINNKQEQDPCLMTLKSKQSTWIGACRFSPDGKRIVAFDYDGFVTIWEAATGKKLLSFRAHSKEAKCCAFSPDGSRIATASNEDDTLRIWNSFSGREILNITGHDQINDFAFSPDGKMLLSVGRSKGGDGQVMLWNPRTGSRIPCPAKEEEESVACGFFPDSIRVVVASESQIAIWNLTSGDCVRVERHEDPILSCAVSPDGLAVVSAAETLILSDARTGEQLFVMEGHSGEVSCCAYSADGAWIASASQDGSLKIWNANSGEEEVSFVGEAREVTFCGFSPDGLLLCSGSNEGTVKIWDTQARAKSHPAERKLRSSCNYSPDGESITAVEANTIKRWDSRTAVLRSSFQIDNTPLVYKIAWSPDSKQICVAAALGRVLICDPESGAEVSSWSERREEIFSCSYSPDGRLVAWATQDALRIFDLRSGQVLTSLPGHDGAATAFQFAFNNFSPDGKLILLGSAINGEVFLRLWNISTHQEVLRVPQKHLNGCAWTPDGRWIVISRGIDICLLDARTGSEVAPTSPMFGLGIAQSIPDNSLTLAVRNPYMLFWDLKTCKRVAALPSDRSISSLALGHAGESAAALLNNGRLDLFRLRDFSLQPPTVTAVRLWHYQPVKGWRRLGGLRKQGYWDDDITARCPSCGHQFVVMNDVVHSIRGIVRNARLDGDESACLRLPDEVWTEPNLLSKCSSCRTPVRFNPFLVDNPD